MRHVLRRGIARWLLCLAIAAPLAAQEAAESDLGSGSEIREAFDGYDRVAGESFGPTLHNLAVGAPDFRPLTSGTTWGYDGAGYLYRTGGPTTFWAPVHLPVGAEIHTVCARGYDAAAATNLTYDFAVYEMATTGALPGFQVILSTRNSGDWPVSATGYNALCNVLSTPYIVREYGDLNGDGLIGPLVYRAVFDLIEADNDHRLGAMEFEWIRIVSPAPGAASYTDVPLGHPQRPYVEALKASGITAGCAAGPARFCPDLPVTRGQLAVFLAKALGLHWSH